MMDSAPPAVASPRDPSSVYSIEPLHASHAKIDAVAERISKDWGYHPGSDLREWVRNTLCGNVFPEFKPAKPEFGYLRVPGTNNATLDIVLSPFTGEFHDRFTIAHELGHYFLHYIAQNRSGDFTVRREGRNRAETEANWFAEGFLMPRNAFVEAWNENDGSIPSLIHRFKLAADVITMRRESLRKLGEDGFCNAGKWA